MNAKIDTDDANWKHLSENAKDFIKKLIEIDPKKRFTAK